MSDKEKLFKKISVPFGSKNIVMTYDGKMKIGADVSEINAEVGKDAEGNVETVAITLPDVEITSNEIDRDSIDFPVEKGTIINKLKNSDYDELETKAEAEIEKSVKESNVMKEAQAELQATLKGYIQGLYGEDVEVSFK